MKITGRLIPYNVRKSIYEELLDNGYTLDVLNGREAYSKNRNLTLRTQLEIVALCQRALLRDDDWSEEIEPGSIDAIVLSVLARTGVIDRYHQHSDRRYHVRRVRDTGTIKKGSFSAWLFKFDLEPQIYSILNTFIRSKSKMTSLPPAYESHNIPSISSCPANPNLPGYKKTFRKFKDLHIRCFICDNFQGNVYLFDTRYFSYLKLAAAHSGIGTSKLYKLIEDQWEEYLERKRERKLTLRGPRSSN